MIDAAYILHTLGELPARTNRDSRQQWAQRILDCQGEQGWFTKRNLRGHSREHATAYAIGALRLLEMEPDERYVDDVRPLLGIKPLLTDERAFKFWLNWLDFRPTPQSVRQKKLGWHYIWRGSHVGGGIPAAVGMTQHLVDDWWPGKVDVAQWLNKYFDWLDAHASARTGYWQRAFWNLAYRRPTIIDMGGAVHFFWVYAACDRGFPYPAPVVKSTISLQKPTGLYKQHPFCIDLDGNFCIIRAFNQLSAAEQARREADVQRAINANFEGVTRALLERPFGEIYSDSHGLPGALVALVECAKLPGFAHAEAVADWQKSTGQSMVAVTHSPASAPPQAEILGVPLTLYDLPQLLAFIADAQPDERRLVLSGNVHSFNLAYENPWLRDFFRSADAVRLDGAGVRIAARLLGHAAPPRMTWADFAWPLAEMAAQQELTVFLLGQSTGRGGKSSSPSAGPRAWPADCRNPPRLF